VKSKLGQVFVMTTYC